MDTIGARAVPRHPDEQRPVMAEVRRPPLLRVGHQSLEVADDGVQIEAVEFLGIVELFAHRIDQRRVVLQTLEIELLRPPVAVLGERPHHVGLFRVLPFLAFFAFFAVAHDRALAFIRHTFLQ